MRRQGPRAAHRQPAAAAEPSAKPAGDATVTGGCTNGLAVSCERTGTTMRIVVAGELDLATAPELHDHLETYAAEQAEITVIDLTAVTFIDSSGIHALLQAVERDGGRVRIIPSARCLRLFEIAGIRDRLPLLVE